MGPARGCGLPRRRPARPAWPSRAADEGAHRIFNLGNGAGLSVREVVDTARLVTGCQIPAVESARRAGDPAVLVASSDLIRSELGWVPEKPELDDMVSDAWSWMRSYGAASN